MKKTSHFSRKRNEGLHEKKLINYASVVDMAYMQSQLKEWACNWHRKIK